MIRKRNSGKREEPERKGSAFAKTQLEYSTMQVAKSEGKRKGIISRGWQLQQTA